MGSTQRTRRYAKEEQEKGNRIPNYWKRLGAIMCAEGNNEVSLQSLRVSVPCKGTAGSRPYGSRLRNGRRRIPRTGGECRLRRGASTECANRNGCGIGRASRN